MQRRRDPVEEASEGSVDLYDISTWEERTSLDGLSVAIYRFLVASTRVGVVLLALLILIGIGGLSALTDPQTGALTILSVLPALGLAAYVWHSDVTTNEPLSLLVATFLLGVLTAGFAAVLNGLLQPGFRSLGVIGTVIFFYVVVGPGEETVKLLAVRLYAFRSDRFDAVVDGAVYGAMAGLGFATIENALYITRNIGGMNLDFGLELIGAGGGITAVRALAGPGHVIYSAFAGYYLGLAKFNEDDAGPIVIKGLLIAAFIHATYNTTVGLGTGLLVVFVGLPQLAAYLTYVVLYDGLFGFLLLRKIHRYTTAYRAANADDRDLDAVASDGSEFE
ncbi:PrsW family intramembrane metalloprotease [Halegenticoccus tardaugens]|uniref:PrsW family intramembrane metalloprotease n=1 Tax=Halegenticoccus tardaugens TaxID=2071624 RepID=UPI00100B00DF|nr:PrsW family glutamic-type intramembrane protease [Halegenticoccus tardaugens]